MSQIGEVAPYLGESESVVAVQSLKSARLSYPNMSGILDMQLSKLQHLDDSASDIPDSAKRIPGQSGSSEPQKKGCMGLLILGAALVAGVLNRIL